MNIDRLDTKQLAALIITQCNCRLLRLVLAGEGVTFFAAAAELHIVWLSRWLKFNF